MRWRSGGTTAVNALKPEEQVAPEPSLGDVGVQVAVGRRHVAHVDLAALHAARAQHLPGLQRVQQLGLDLQRQLPDLVQEHRAALGGLQQAGLGLHRAR